MKELNVRQVILEKNPDFLEKAPGWIRNMVFYLIEKVLHIKDINAFLAEHHDKRGLPFVDEVFETLDITYSVTKRDRDRIPSQGKLVIIANHPLGGLDGLALLKMVSEVRTDVKVLVNDILMEIDNLSDFFLPYDITVKRSQRANLMAIKDAINKEMAIIVFPAGAVSRLKLSGIKDLKWQTGALYFAKKFNAHILPVYIHAKNSLSFYLMASLHPDLGQFFLPREMFNKKGKVIEFSVGNPLPPDVFPTKVREKHQLLQLRKHHRLIGKGKRGVFREELTIIHPVSRKLLKQELAGNEILGRTLDGKVIYLVDFANSPEIKNEIGRLREQTFRKVGEGTGKKTDTDKFDTHYKHIVLWDDKELEIVGSYRIGECRQIVEEHGEKGLYTSTLFRYSDEFRKMLPQAIELGRSFVQSAYWNTYALDYLWQGLGAYVYNHPEIKYLFGPVSLSNSYSPQARRLITYFYKKWFGRSTHLAKAKSPYRLTANVTEEMSGIFNSESYQQDLRALRNQLKIQGFSIPILYRQYSELCEDDGVKFVDFGIDIDFQNCIDAFVVVELGKIKQNKRERYIRSSNIEQAEKQAVTA